MAGPNGEVHFVGPAGKPIVNLVDCNPISIYSEFADWYLRYIFEET
jgi:hypothetical protein